MHRAMRRISSQLAQACRSFSASAAQAEAKELAADSIGSSSVRDVLREKRMRMGETGAWLYVTQNDSVYAAIQKMAKANVGSLLVLDESTDEEGWTDASRVVGIISERDYLKKIALHGRNSRSTPVRDIMTSRDRMITVNPNHSVLEAMHLMTRANIRHLPVVDESSEHMEGMLSIRDVVERVVREQRESLHQMEEYLKGSY